MNERGNENLLQMRKRENAEILLVCWLRKEKYVSEFYHEDGGRIRTICKECTKAQRIKSPMKTVKRDFLRIQTLCCCCKYAVGRCSWSEVDESKKDRPIKYEPVSGWVAVKTERGDYNSYVVLSCPEFVPDDN